MIFSKFIKTSLFRDTGFYAATNVMNAALPFLLLPVLTRYLSPKDYGIAAMFGIAIGIVSVCVGLNSGSAAARQYFDRDKIDINQYVVNCMYITVASSVLVALILWIFSSSITNIMAIPHGWLWAVWFIATGYSISYMVLNLWQVQSKPALYGTFQILSVITNLSLAIFFVVFLAMKWQGRILAQVFSAGIFAVVALIALKKNGWLKGGFRSEYIKDALKIGVPLVPHSIGGLAIVMTDRVLITNMIGIADTGIYVVGAQIGMIIGLIEDSFNRAWVPWLFGKLTKGVFTEKIKIVKITYLYNLLILVAALVVAVMGPKFLNIFVGKDFRGAGIYIFWIALGYAFSGMYKMVVNYIFYVKKTSILAWITFFTAVMNAFFSYYLIRLNGTIGAAQGTALAFFVSYIFTWMLSTKVYKMPWGFWKTKYAHEL